MARKPDRPDASAPKKRVRGGPGAWKDGFLDVLRRGGSASQAAKDVGISRQAAYEARQRDEEFAVAWADAHDEFVDMLEGVAVRRATVGVEKGIYHAGKQVGTERQVSDTLLIFMLKAERPEKFRDHYTPDPAAAPRAAPILGDRDPVEIDPEKREEAARLLLEGLDELPAGADD